AEFVHKALVSECEKYFAILIERLKRPEENQKILEYLNKRTSLKCSGHITPDQLNILLKACPQITSLTFSSCRELTGETLRKALQDVNLSNISSLKCTSDITDTQLKMLLNVCRNVTSLDLSSCRSLMDEAFKDVSR